MRKIFFVHTVATALVTSTLAVPMVSTPAFSEETVPSDDFIAQASRSGDFEIQSSQLALKRTTSEEVKTFARQMIKDHTKVSKQLSEIAITADLQKKKDVSVDLGSDNLKLLEDLNNLSDKEFDKEYVRIQKEKHQQAVVLFQSYSQYGDNPRLQEFAKVVLPELQGHLKHIMQIDKRINDVQS